MKTILKGITWEHARGYESVVAASNYYNSIKPDLEVQWSFRSLQSFADQPLERLVEEYDLLVIDHPHIPFAAENQLLARLDGVGFDENLKLLESQTVGKSHVSYSHLGGQWGLASDAAAQVSAFRPDLIDEAPNNWNEVFELAEQNRVVWPYKPVDSWSSIITIASGLGEEPMRKPGLFVSTEVLEESFSILKRLAQLVPENNQFWNPIDAADALAEGDQFAYCPLLFGYTNYSRKGFRKNLLTYTNIPQSIDGVNGSLLGGAGITVSAKSKNLEQAIEHAFWLASAETQEGIYFDGGGQPGNSVAWESDRTNLASNDFFRNTRATLEGAYLRPRKTNYIELQNELSEIVTEALLGKVSLNELERRLNDGVTEFLDR